MKKVAEGVYKIDGTDLYWRPARCLPLQFILFAGGLICFAGGVFAAGLLAGL